MVKFNHDFSSRFRILKGGKVSLVVSAMLLGAISADAGTLTNASIVPNSNVVGAKTNYTFSFTTESEVTADNYILYAWLPSNFSFSHASGTSDNNNFAIPCSDVVESITVDGFPSTCDAARSFSPPSPFAVQISLDSVVRSGANVVVKLKNINNSTTVGSSDFVMLGTSLPGGILDGYSSKTVSLVDGTVFNATVDNTENTPVLDVNLSHGDAHPSWDGYINLGNKLDSNSEMQCTIATGKHYYQTQTFIATGDGTHTIDTASLNDFYSSELETNDNFMAVYQGVFDPSNPTANLIGCNDDKDYNNNEFLASFSTNLTSGQVYTMVFTSSASQEYAEQAFIDPIKGITGTGSFSVTPEVSLAYSLSGTVSGLENGETLTLSGVGSTDKVISANGSFIFDTPLANSANFNITATLSNASNQFRTCTVTNGNGAISSANINNIAITCTENVNYAPVFGVGSGKMVLSTPDNLNDSVWDIKYQESSGKYIALTTTGILRFDADGNLDSTFGTNGKILASSYTSDSSGIAFDVDSQGRIILAEDMDLARNAYKTNFQIRRLSANGTLDADFGTSGVFSVDLRSTNDNANGVKILSDDSIIVLGQSIDSSNNRYEAAAIKVTNTGTLDATFGTSGKLYIPQTSAVNEAFEKAVIDASGNIYAMGYGSDKHKTVVAKFSSTGVLDANFGTGGIVYVDADSTMGASYVSEYANDIALQSDGKIVITGMLGVQVNSTSAKAGVIRLNTNGVLDSTFGTNGIVSLDNISNHNEIGRGITINSDGTILVSASVDYNLNSNEMGSFYVTKLTSNGTIDTTFGKNGIYLDAFIVQDNFYGSGGMINKLFISKNDEILGIGQTIEPTGIAYGTPALIKLSLNGIADINFGIQSKVGSTVKYSEGGTPIVLESSAYLYDRDLYNTNYNGVRVNLVRQGGASTNDIFGATGNLTLTDGNVKVSNTTIGTFTNRDGNLTITFNSDANQTLVNEALKSITYENNATSLPSSVVIAWSVNDNNSGNQGSGGALSGTGTTTVTIQKVPKISGSSATATEDGSYTLTVADFGTYSPIGSESEFTSIKIISLPTNGVLKNGGSTVNVNDEISANNISNGDLTFTPNSNTFGTGAGNFSFQVGVSSQETSYQNVWSPTYTMELNVSGINDAPSFKVSEGVSYIEISNFNFNSSATDFMKVQSDGKILVAGLSYDNDDYDKFEIRRYNADWTLDSSFGTNGISTFDMGTSNDDYPTNMTVDNIGNIYLTGMARGSSRDYVIVKLNSNGVLVNTFGDGGKKIIDLVGTGSSDYARKIMLLDNGKIIVAGDEDYTTHQAILVGLTADGQLDTTFGTSGKLAIDKVTTNDYDSVASATLWTIGEEQKILLSVEETNNTYLNRLMVLNSDGTPYTTFATNGIFSQSGKYFYSFLPLADGNILIGGYDNSESKSTIFKLTPTGILENILAFDFGSRIKELKKDSEGNIYAVAYTDDDGVLVSKFSSSGVVDANFGTNGVKSFTLNGMDYSNSYSIDFDKNGNLLVYVESTYNDGDDTLRSIIILDKATGEIKTIGGESSLGQSVNHNRSTPTVLDSDATIKDSELDSTGYNGSIVSIVREGGANSEDLFSFTDTVIVSGNTLSIGTKNVGTFIQSDGNLTITFGSDANTTLVNTTLRNITYQNSGSGDVNTTINWIFSDGNSATNGTQGSGGTKITSGTTKVAITGTYTPPSRTNSVNLSVPYKTGTTEVVIASPNGTNITSAINNSSEKTPAKGVTMPLGTFAFNVGGLTTNGQTVTMSMIVDKSIGSYSYYKKNRLTNKWTNITKAVTFLANNKVKIEFDLTDGGVYDTDGSANGTIVDPGGIATNKLTPYVVEGTTLVGDASFVEDPTLFRGTITYGISGGADASKFNINATTGELTFKTAPSYTTPTDLGDIAGNNTYVVEISVTGSTSGSESRAITVSVLKADGSNTVTPIAPAISSENITISQGTVNGATKITYTPATGNSIKYIFSQTALAIPAYNATLPTGATTYTSGTNIVGAEVDKYLTIYELDSARNIVGYYQQIITREDIKDIPVLSLTTPILDQVIDVSYVNNFHYDLRDNISNAIAYSFVRTQHTDATLSWLTINHQTGELSASGSVPVGTYYIEVTASDNISNPIKAYFTIRVKDLTANLDTYITKPSSSTATTGIEGTKTYAETTVVNSDVKVYSDGTAQHTITGIAEAISKLPDSVVTISDIGDVTTSTTTINAVGDIVDIKVEGKTIGDIKATHTLKVDGKETKASSKISGTTTTINEDRTVETKATVSGREMSVVAQPDGKATHILKVGLVESKATIEITGATTTIDTTGITTSVDDTKDGITIKSIVKTDTQGESQTWFEDSNGQQLERTVSQTTPLESGAEVNVSKDGSGKLQFKIKTKVTRDLVIE